MAADSFDYDTLMKRHLKEVFSEPNAEKRDKALQELYDPSAILFEPNATKQGLPAISEVVSTLLTSAFPPGFEFVPSGQVLGHHGVMTVAWDGVVKGEKPIVTGVDVCHVNADGRITAVYVFLNK